MLSLTLAAELEGVAGCWLGEERRVVVALLLTPPWTLLATAGTFLRPLSLELLPFALS